MSQSRYRWIFSGVVRRRKTARSVELKCGNPLRIPQRPIQRLHEEILSPHDRLVYAQSLMQMVDAAFENSLPLRIARRQVSLAQRSQDAPRGISVALGLHGIPGEVRQLQQARGRTGQGDR